MGYSRNASGVSELLTIPADAVAAHPQGAEVSQFSDLRGEHLDVVVRQPQFLQTGQVPNLR